MGLELFVFYWFLSTCLLFRVFPALLLIGIVWYLSSHGLAECSIGVVGGAQLQDYFVVEISFKPSEGIISWCCG